MGANRFGNFEGRSRERDRLIKLLQADGAFVDLPHHALEFVERNYDGSVPYHNPVHVLSGLLYLHHSDAPKLARIAWVGHDAGHNGSAAESPEVVSALLTYEWLKSEPGWLEAFRFNPQECTESINDTRFPYGWPCRSEASGYVRLADTLRIASGDHVQYLGGGGTPFHAYLYESVRFCDELHAAKNLPEWNARGDLLTWLERGQVGFFFQTLIKDVLTGDRFSGLAFNDAFVRLHENQRLLSILLSNEAGREKLLGIYDFLGKDVTFPEFVAYCRGMGV